MSSDGAKTYSLSLLLTLIHLKSYKRKGEELWISLLTSVDIDLSGVTPLSPDGR